MSPRAATPESGRRSDSRSTSWWALALLLGVVGVVCIGVGLHVRSAASGRLVTPAAGGTAFIGPSVAAVDPTTIATRSTVRPSTHSAGTSRTSRTRPRHPGAVLRAPVSVPVHLSIPAIAVSRPLLRLGLHADGTVEVPAPEDAATPGWFRLGPTPGQVGSSVILGHVDSLKGPAVFYELRFLHAGNHVDVRLRAGVVAHFTVQRVATYPNADFPAREVYAAHGVRALNLVTCGGFYDRARGGYQSNVVVYTRLTGTSRA